MKKRHITKQSVFTDLEFSQAEATNLTARADLMIAIKCYITEHHLTQAKAAEHFGVDQPQISRLLNGDIDHFSVDKLLNMLSRVGIRVTWKIAA